MDDPKGIIELEWVNTRGGYPGRFKTKEEACALAMLALLANDGVNLKSIGICETYGELGNLTNGFEFAQSYVRGL